MSTHIGYKKAANNTIVVLEILELTNESRTNIWDKSHAMMRTSGARVLDIYNMNDKSMKISTANSIYDTDFVYEVGKVVRVPYILDARDPCRYPVDFDDVHQVYGLDKLYDMKEGMVHTTGIHYFLTEEVAYFWDFHPPDNYAGEIKYWKPDGELMGDTVPDCIEVNGCMRDLYDHVHCLTCDVTVNIETDSLYCDHCVDSMCESIERDIERDIEHDIEKC
jgi:hypothetical protein